MMTTTIVGCMWWDGEVVMIFMMMIKVRRMIWMMIYRLYSILQFAVIVFYLLV